MDDRLFTCEIHHGGHFVENPLRYVDGFVNHVDDCDHDLWSKLEVEDIVRRLGYNKHRMLWYKIPGLGLLEGLRVIGNDRDAMHMTECVRGHDQIEVYVEHVIEDVESVVDNLALPAPQMDEEVHVNAEADVGMKDVEVEEDIGQENVYYNSDTDDSVIDVDYPLSDDSSYDDVRFDKYDAPQDEIEGRKVHNELFDSDNERENEGNQARTNEVHEGGMKSDYESEELISGGSESDTENEDNQEQNETLYLSKFEVFKPVDKAENLRFKIGMLFSSLQQFKTAITEYAVHGGYGIKFVKNDRSRVRVVCQKGCPWRMLCTKLPRQITYQLKTCEMEHKCNRTYENVRLSSKFLAGKLVNKVKDHPNVRLSKIQEKVHNKFVVQISRSKAYRAKRRALDQVEGSHKEQYVSLWDYCNELRRSNPGSTVTMEVVGFNVGDAEGERSGAKKNPTFKRLYVCFDACKKGFAACRPVIGIDGCHLKGPYGGILLAAVGRDPNEEYFPVAFAVVEAENKASWTWFISLLLEDVGSHRTYTFTSDQQKGLDTTLKDLQPNGEHRFCCRHFYNNLRKKHLGVLIKEFFWKAAYASYGKAFERCMNDLMKADGGAHKWVEGVPPHLWSRHAFSGNAKTDTLLNNLCEGFNSTILEAREKPIISMVESIRMYLMLRFQKNRGLIEKVEGVICPVIQKKLKKEIVESGKWTPYWSGQLKYEVKFSIGNTTHCVDLEKRECTCRRWDISGVPCGHAISAIHFNKQNVEDYTSDYYKVETYKRVYAPLIYPTNGSDLWKSTGLPPILPPPQRRPTGRPKKLRRREPDEPNKGVKLRRSGTTVVCKRCGRTGHNKRTCKGVVGGNEDLPRESSTQQRKVQGRKPGKKTGSGAGNKTSQTGGTVAAKKTGPTGGPSAGKKNAPRAAKKSGPSSTKKSGPSAAKKRGKKGGPSAPSSGVPTQCFIQNVSQCPSAPCGDMPAQCSMPNVSNSANVPQPPTSNSRKQPKMKKSTMAGPKTGLKRSRVSNVLLKDMYDFSDVHIPQ
ncbi:hypothetical protein Vadar_022329 [Vaccinium darrowii]|uniref:Uncharacterized protein n=1 Tax=Vaccinium darrowii TaxID=229202 RepID=A0ACB7YPZ5_9ERIC|nr:hypothetical protein Vadar_022329 [Vaccinium darrowii]